MKIFLLPILAVLAISSPAQGQSVTAVDREWRWTSPNFREMTTAAAEESRTAASKPGPALGAFSYQRHFDTHGQPPPFPFLKPLGAAPSSMAQLQRGQISFPLSRKTFPLTYPALPPGAQSAPPYLLAVPQADRILVVYPYFLHQDKESRHITEIYSGRGELLKQIQSLPTHAVADNPSLLISLERTGCCESLKWTVRFYNLTESAESEFGCPEGFCGNLLFTRLGPAGPFLLGQEIMGKAAEAGGSLQTNLYLVDQKGGLLASAKALYLLRENGMDPRRLEAQSPWAISALGSVESISKEKELAWLFRFEKKGRPALYRLTTQPPGPSPAPVFLLAKDPGLNQMQLSVKANEQPLGRLPLLAVADPGKHRFSIDLNGEERSIIRETQSDQVYLFLLP